MTEEASTEDAGKRGPGLLSYVTGSLQPSHLLGK